MAVRWTEIENKWRAKWQENKDFETDPNEKPKKFITVAYPYPNSPQHIGHGRTYTLADVHARFYRMKGYNVLFPMGFHYTGTPILGMAKRIEAGEEEILDALRNVYHVSEDAIKTFVEPIKIADYFHKEIKSGMIEMGYSIDWRREFTTIVPGYQKFIEWQISTLEERGRIIQGSHPVGWCPVDQNPVSQHDTMGDVEPKIDDKNFLIKFKLGELVFPITTLRPETIFGITNLWVNPDTVYKKVSVDNETWIVSAECAKKISFFEKKVSEIGEISGSDIIGKHATGHDGRDIPILPADFVESSMGTGLVMSVPGHAPKDYQALMDLKAKNHELASELEPVSIIATEGYGLIPAKDIVEKMGISDQADDRLEEATKELYLKEFTDGKLNGRCGQFDGEKVQFGREKIMAWLQENGNLEKFPVLENAPVHCRCGAECVVKVLNNQWFLNYGDEEWKELGRDCLDEMNILPNNIKTEFVEVIDWLHERACARQQGLGTKLPWAKDWIVESLSDSVIYMAYYTLSRFVNDGTVAPENLTKEFFDYVLLDKGDVELAASASKLSQDLINTMKKEFTYFYPVDSRHSGRDLVQNHLSFFVLNHVAIFEKNLWPQEIVVNGSVMMNGAKMSKSMGNIIPLRDAIKAHGADPIRLAIISSAELLQDADFNMESVSGIQSKLGSLLEECSRLRKSEIGQLQAEDIWILSKTQGKIAEITEAVEKMRLREALHDILFTFEADLSWYNKRVAAKNRDDDEVSGILHKINSARVTMLSPFAPHVAEEMWEKLGNLDLVSKSPWPEYNASEVDAASIQAEELLKGTISDIGNIIRVAKITPKKIVLYVSSDEFKSKVYRKILSIMVGGQNNMGDVMRELILDPETADAKRNPDFVQKTIKDLHSESENIKKMRLEAESFDEKEFLRSELSGIGKKEFGVEVEVCSESDEDVYDPKGKARHARPFKPAILIE